MKARNLMLKTVGPKGEAYGGFIWPLTVGSVVEAPDWDPSRQCGGGLHGLLGGRGNASLLDWGKSAKWLVIEVLESLVSLGDKAKCKAVIIRYCGDQSGATAYLYRHTHNLDIVGLVFTGGDCATLTGGNYATLTGGNRATLTGGNYATLTGGYHAILTGGDCATFNGGTHAVFIQTHGRVIAKVDNMSIFENRPYQYYDEKWVEVKKNS